MELLRAKLSGAGYMVETAQDGVSGLNLIRKNKYDLILLDMLLPGMTGFEILEKMKAEGLLPKMPVLIISNSGQTIELERALQLGARDYLIKVNFDPQEVLSRVQNILKRQEDAASGSPRAGEENISVSGARGILIVEDDLLLVGLLEPRFSDHGFRVHKALDADQAGRVLDANPIDVILLDIVLPGADGFTFLKGLKQDARRRAIPVIIISNLGQREEIDKGMRLGAADYIIKADSSPTEIVQKVEKILKK